jgi:5-(carboxyamino)imidazole ribonucleotide mutase
VATFAIGEPGAANAGLFAVSMLANNDEKYAKKLSTFRKKQRTRVRAMKLPKV